MKTENPQREAALKVECPDQNEKMPNDYVRRRPLPRHCIVDNSRDFVSPALKSHLICDKTGAIKMPQITSAELAPAAKLSDKHHAIHNTPNKNEGDSTC